MEQCRLLEWLVVIGHGCSTWTHSSIDSRLPFLLQTPAKSFGTPCVPLPALLAKPRNTSTTTTVRILLMQQMYQARMTAAANGLEISTSMSVVC